MNASALLLVEELAPPVRIDDDDSLLVARMQAGDESAYEELVRANGGRMLSTARRMVRREEDAHDVVQEAFLHAFRSVATFEGRSRLSTWLHRIVINVSLMKLRSRKRKPEVSIEDQTPRFHADGSRIVEAHDYVDLSPADALERERLRVLMRRCMDRLPESYRVVLMLRDIEDLTTEETAAMLGIKTVAVKVRLHRARQALKTLVQKEMMDGAGAC
ncbi:MAG TPA: sigma-70 family RNA polymerase sigma factor [Candidatus Limnocylindrales bacterium]|nr:sigma-70 family RNA polymerase sigma factor [Candidatus Limnocylindrales bacterium]